jgi:hypothetical protein
MIYRKHEYVQDQTGDEQFRVKVIDELTDVLGQTVRYIGRATVNMQTPLGIQQFPVSFEIEAASIEEAFAAYSQMAGPKVESVRRHVQALLDRLKANCRDDSPVADAQTDGNANARRLRDSSTQD